MSARGINRLVQRMRCLAEARHEDTPDAQLIERFVNQRDETAFATLVHRHGPMVHAVCRRELRDSNDADDAFQATFLVFARKANSLNQRERVAAWLHGVAHRTARKARVVSARRRAVSMDLHNLPGPEPVQELAWRELQFVLDEELERLPVKYREPIVLCYLEGMTYSAAAHCLGIPAGTVSGRLDRARELLRCRLMRRGLALSAGLLGTLLTHHATAAELSPAILRSTLESGLTFGGRAAGSLSGKAVWLADATLRSLFYAKCKLVAGIVFASVALLGSGFWLQRSMTDLSQPAQVDNPKRPFSGKRQPVERSAEAQRVLDRAILAVGGKEKATSLKSASWTMVWNAGDAMQRKHRITARGHDQIRVEMEYSKNGKSDKSLYILNKDVGWRREADGSAAELPPAMRASNKERYYALRLGDLLAFLGDEEVSLTPLGEGTIDKQAVIGVRVEREAYPTVKLYFNKQSGLLHRSETLLSPRPDGAQSMLVYTFEDYRDSAGLLRYTRVTSKLDDQLQTIGHIQDFVVLEKVDDRLFDKP